MTQPGSGQSGSPCRACDGEGYTYAVYGQLDTYEECAMCDGTGDRDGRGLTKPEPAAPKTGEQK